MRIAVVQPPAFETLLPSLADLLIDAVDGGASIGFLPPLDRATALDYWRDTGEAVRCGARVLLAATQDGAALGAVQLGLETRANGDHRGEILKLMVHRRARRQRLATALMDAAENEARARGRTLLLLDTERESAAETLYERRGWTRFGEVPRYARSAGGELHTTVFFYLELPPLS